MTDLNSLSKEELIKLVAQKEEQLRAAEDLAEKRERSNIKFARGVTSLTLLLKDVNGSYLAQVEELSLIHILVVHPLKKAQSPVSVK